MDLSQSEQQALKSLVDLRNKNREKTYKKFKRINPFCEDLFSWKEKGKFWTGKDNITIYDSASVSGDVTIGDNSWIGPFVNLDGSGGLTIGDFCSISSGCQILSHDTAFWAVSGGVESYSYSETAIGSYCFLGSHAVVTRGVKVGNHCIIGAGAVLTKSFPSNSIIAGVPAKVIGTVIVDSETGKVTCSYHEGNSQDK